MIEASEKEVKSLVIYHIKHHKYLNRRVGRGILKFNNKERKMENLKKEIEQLKQEKNAVLLAHYYVDDAVQEIADYVGDSYYLAKVALKESKDVICFAGVNFMGESARS